MASHMRRTQKLARRPMSPRGEDVSGVGARSRADNSGVSVNGNSSRIVVLTIVQGETGMWSDPHGALSACVSQLDFNR